MENAVRFKRINTYYGGCWLGLHISRLPLRRVFAGVGRRRGYLLAGVVPC